MLKSLSDKELWQGVKDGDRNALEVLFERYYFYLLKIGVQYCDNVELAKDAISDVFFNLWNKRNALSDVDQVKSYLGVTYRNELLKILKKQNKDQQLLSNMFHTDTFEASYEDVLVSLQHREDLKIALRTAFEQLSPKQKEYLKLKFFGGLSYEQISEKTGQTMKTVYNTTYEALKILRQKLAVKKIF